MKNNIRNRLISGTLLLIPFAVALQVFKWLFQWMAGWLEPVLRSMLEIVKPHTFLQFVQDKYLDFCISTISVIALVVVVYLVGIIGKHFIGKQIIAGGESLILRIPLIGSIYSAAKQVIAAVTLPSKGAFKSVVLVEFPGPGLTALGFLTGYIHSVGGKKFCKVFIPTAPNPTSGFFEIIPAENVIETAISVEDAFKTIISGGVVSPELLDAPKPPETLAVAK